jgi:flagellar biosynthesis/type III secretory pathway ATPase
LIAAHHQAEDLVRIGAYQKGTDPVLDKAIAALPEINRFLRQTPSDRTSMNETLQQLFALPC